MLVLDLTAFFLSMAVLGEPLRCLVCHYSDVFAELDVLQVLILNLFLGGFLLYVLMSLPLRLFSFATLAALLIFCVFFVAWRLLRKLASIRLDSLATSMRTPTLVHAISAICVVLVFAFVFWIELVPMESQVLGSIDDTSLHSLFVQLMVNERMVPYTAMPFLPEVIIFPQGHTVFFASASVLLNWISAKAVLYVTPLFIALSTFGAYFFGKKISGKPAFGAFLAFTAGLVATHPRYLTWGGNPFAAAFPFFMICLGVISSNAGIADKTKKDLLVEGLLLGFLATIYLTAFLVIMLLLVFNLCLHLVTKGNRWKSIRNYLLLFSCSILLILPNILRFLSFYSIHGHNIGLPVDVRYDLSSLSAPSPLWALETITTQRFPLNIYVSSLIVLGVLALVITQQSSFERRLVKITIGTFLAPIILLFLANNIMLISEVTGACTCILELTSLNLPISFFLYYVITTFVSPQSNSIRDKKSKINKVFVVSALLFIFLSPFVFYPLLNDQMYLAGAYGCYAVTTQDDYSLMLWMKDNLDQTSTRVLVNRYDAGNFIPSVSNLVAVYPYSGSQLSTSYGEVTDNLHFGRLTAYEYDFMKENNITHVFIGSKAAFWWTGDHKWYPRFFLDNPNFGSVKNIGDAYLFGVLYNDLNHIFYEDFNYSSLQSRGWNVYVPQCFSNAGTGYASTGSFESAETPCLKICTEKHENASLYWYSIVKDIYLGDHSGVTDNITISFYAKLSSGFCSSDALIFIISSGDWQQQVYFSTSLNIGVRQEMIILLGTDGSNEFNLSTIWVSIYGNLPPTAPHLQIAIQDTDSSENVAFLTNILITTNNT